MLYATAADMRDVIVAGEVLMRRHRPLRVDESAIARIDVTRYRLTEPWDGRTNWSHA